jgi:hypothetical protein
MELIVAMNDILQHYIPGQVGRYDDAFNPNCVGDTFQMTGTPTVLFEAGHYFGDYDREYTREYLFHALLTALRTIEENKVDALDDTDYFQIPENQKLFFDVLIKNVHIIDSSQEKGNAIGLLYGEKLEAETIRFVPEIEETGDLGGYFGHKVYDCTIRSDRESLKQRSELISCLTDS